MVGASAGAGFGAVDGALFDLGLSSFQLADRERGFGFRAGGPLDMRFDTTRGVPASELIANLSADELAALFRKYGEEPSAWKLAKAIVAARSAAPIGTAEALAKVIEDVSPGLMVADLVALIASLDVVAPEIDR